MRELLEFHWFHERMTVMRMNGVYLHGSEIGLLAERTNAIVPGQRGFLDQARDIAEGCRSAAFALVVACDEAIEMLDAIGK